ncbi:GPW/gp25 family protein [Nonomuraea sp. B1E8]|uniref:GPW/gp25 family protein n=1 Tax=unclassified Nonomuraea TaxID=2593643 RepID=UPI00325D38B5
MTPARHVGFPLRVGSRGRTTLVSDEDYLRGLVETVLFTRPGERVNRPDFGSGVDRLVFAPTGDEMVHASRTLVHGALQRWLGDLVQVDDVVVEAHDSRLRVTVTYVPLFAGTAVGERRSLSVLGGSP